MDINVFCIFPYHYPPRLWICGIAVAIAMFGLAWDFLYPFPLSRPVLIICSGSYFLLMGVLTLYTTYKEKVRFLPQLLSLFFNCKC